MDLFKKITSVYPELTSADFQPLSGSILLQDDGDGIQYLAAWNYSNPMPQDLKVGK